MLSGKQKAYLRSLAQNERAIFQIGKDGLSDTLIKTLNDALKARGYERDCF
jgi:RNA-binding protein